MIMIKILNHSVVKSVNSTNVYQFEAEMVGHDDSNTKSLERNIPLLLKDIENIIKTSVMDKVKVCVVLMFKEILNDELYFSISKLIQRHVHEYDYNIILSGVSTSHKTSKGKEHHSAQQLIQNLFQSERAMSKMIKNYINSKNIKPPVNKDDLVSLILRLLEIQNLELNEEELIEIVSNYKTLKEVASAMKSSLK